MKKFKIILLLLFCNLTIEAQEINWVKGGGSTKAENFILSKIDPVGNIGLATKKWTFS